MTNLLQRIRHLEQAILRLDGTLAVMSPGYDPSTIKPKRRRTEAKLFSSRKLDALILDALRRGDGPMSLVETGEAGGGPRPLLGLRAAGVGAALPHEGAGDGNNQ